MLHFSSRVHPSRSRLCGSLALLLGTGAATAYAEERGQPGVASYCDYIESSAASAVSGKQFPQLFVSGGALTNAGAIDLAGHYDSMSTLWRLEAGLSYSLADGLEASAIQARARAECVLYRQQSELFAFLSRYDESDSIAGAKARVNVLSRALPQAESILERQRDFFQRHQTTVEEINATSVRLDALRAELGSSRLRVAAFQRKHEVSGESIRQVMSRYRRAVEETARSESRVRTSRSFDLSLRGGYDRIFGVRDGIPLFAMLTLTISPVAIFRQPALERQAQQGRFAWESQGLEGIHDRVAVLLARLQEVFEAQQRRRSDAKLLLADLEGRYKAVEHLPGDAVRAYRDYLWFDLTRMRAESSYLDAQVEELRALLSDP